MKLEAIAGRVLARMLNYPATTNGAELATVQHPTAFAILVKELAEAEQRGHARGKAETVDGGPIEDDADDDGGLPVPPELVGEITRAFAERVDRQFLPPELVAIYESRPLPLAGILGGFDYRKVVRDEDVSAYAAGLDPAKPQPFGDYSDLIQLVNRLLPTPATPPVADADPADVAAHEFCCERPCGIGFLDGTGVNLEVRMVEPRNSSDAVRYVRNAARELLRTAIVERDVAWSVALAEAGMNPAPLTPDAVGLCVELAERQTDQAWADAFRAVLLAGEVAAFIPHRPDGVAEALRQHANSVRRDVIAHFQSKFEELSGKYADHVRRCDERLESAAKVATRRERDACFKLAQERGHQLMQAAVAGFPFTRRGIGHRADGAFDVAQAILERDDADVPTVAEDDARPVARGD